MCQLATISENGIAIFRVSNISQKEGITPFLGVFYKDLIWYLMFAEFFTVKILDSSS